MITKGLIQLFHRHRNRPRGCCSHLLVAFLISTAAGGAQNVQEIRAPFAGTALFLAREGPVKKGAPLVAIDPSGLIASLPQAVGDLALAESEWKSLSSRQEAAKAAAEAKVAAAQKALEDAEAALARYREADQPVKEMGLKQAVADATWLLQKEKRQFSERDRLLAESLISAAEHEEMGIRVGKAETSLAVAERQLDAHERFEKPQQLANLEKAVAGARQEVEAVLGAREKIPAKAEAEKAAAEKKLADSRAALQSKLDRAGQAVLTAPADGIFRPRPVAELASGTGVSEGGSVGTLTLP